MQIEFALWGKMGSQNTDVLDQVSPLCRSATVEALVWINASHCWLETDFKSTWTAVSRAVPTAAAPTLEPSACFYSLHTCIVRTTSYMMNQSTRMHLTRTSHSSWVPVLSIGRTETQHSWHGAVRIMKRFMKMLLVFGRMFRPLRAEVILGWKLCEAQP